MIFPKRKFHSEEVKKKKGIRFEFRVKKGFFQRFFVEDFFFSWILEYLSRCGSFETWRGVEWGKGADVFKRTVGGRVGVKSGSLNF